MRFTYDAYLGFLRLLSVHKYYCANYHDWKSYSRCVILRHDIDYDIARAMPFAEWEAKAGWRGTYFVLVRSDFYNVFSRKNLDFLKRISSFGHEIGLHFDEMAYPEAIGNVEKISSLILEEVSILGEALGQKVKCVSMHRPSQSVLKANLEIPGMINSYEQVFFHEFKYLSDSRCHWREPLEEIIKSEQFDWLHILTHPFWYEEKEKSIKTIIQGFLNRANYERYLTMRDNFTNLDEVFTKEDSVKLRETEVTM